MKKILAVYGSPRAASGSAALCRALLKQKSADDTVTEYFAYVLNAKPCIACGGCEKQLGCVQHDLDAFYRDFEAADYVVFASPVYNGGFPAPLKAIIDRFQCYYAKRFTHNIKPPIAKPRKAVLLLTGGSEAAGSREIARMFRQQCTVLNTELVSVLVFSETDRRQLDETDFAQAQKAGADLFEEG